MDLAVISPYTLQPHNHPNPNCYRHYHHLPHPHRHHHHHARSAKVDCWPWFRARGFPWVLGYCSHFHCWLCHRHHHPVFDETKFFTNSKTFLAPNFSKPHFSGININPRPILRLFRYYFFGLVPFRTYIQAFVSLLITITVPIPPKMERSKEREVLRAGRLTHDDHGDHNNHDDHHCQWTT